jgi:hypothetical protein
MKGKGARSGDFTVQIADGRFLNSIWDPESEI